MISWRPVTDISAPIRIIHLDVDDFCTDRREVLAAPYFLTLWRDDRPIAQFRAFSSSEPPLDWRTVERVSKASTPAPATQISHWNISLVICTRDRPRDLDRCLASLVSQSRRPDETIVVDNASHTDETRQVTERHGVVYVREDRPGLGIARNRGTAVSGGEIVAYTDDDVVLRPSWLRRIEDAFDGNKIWAVTGLTLPNELETEAQCLFEKTWGFSRGFQRRDFGSQFYSETRQWGSPAWEIGGGGNMAVRREVFDKIGGFDERLGAGAAGCSEDSEFLYRVLHAGGVCRYEPSAVVYHFHRRTLEELRAQIRAYMRGHVAALLVQHERTGEWGNLRRLYRSLLSSYLGQGLRRLAGQRSASTCLCLDEVRGCLEGVSYYWTAPRSLRSTCFPPRVDAGASRQADFNRHLTASTRSNDSKWPGLTGNDRIIESTACDPSSPDAEQQFKQVYEVRCKAETPGKNRAVDPKKDHRESSTRRQVLPPSR